MSILRTQLLRMRKDKTYDSVQLYESKLEEACIKDDFIQLINLHNNNPVLRKNCIK